ncbi:conserved hypothetical protein [Anaeromyxobacter dehalogenans 2CP-1]|uniref:Uncharacterized protein n=1 Tax=Anaeromyxobacter dehalogenans (strain ATCC BAA-258 / DSM 21875 / 2CP-1) TaxID=455488 RepID=B8JAM4_ANAD2|nr:hypothetical protein [Anaeromyxobacter dehalogenans]ACL67523.1 conserved hypothetical protein [Anaeromyxobacter dehalogenans 2CP-1]
MNPIARTAGHVLALTALVLAFAAAAQGPIYRPHAAADGILPWVFAAFVAAAVVALFLFVLWMVKPPNLRPPSERPHGALLPRSRR